MFLFFYQNLLVDLWCLDNPIKRNINKKFLFNIKLNQELSAHTVLQGFTCTPEDIFDRMASKESLQISITQILLNIQSK